MDVKQHLIDALEPFGFPVYQQGSMSDDDDYPPTFFTFWNNDTTSAENYDNEEHAYVWDFDLNVYGDDPQTVNATLREARKILKSAGFTVDGIGYDVISDEPTHTGRGVNVLYLEREVQL